MKRKIYYALILSILGSSGFMASAQSSSNESGKNNSLIPTNHSNTEIIGNNSSEEPECVIGPVPFGELTRVVSNFIY